MNRRAEQMAAAIQEAVREVLARGLQDPRVSGLVTVTGVTVTEDFAEAEIGVSILPAERSREAMEGLASAANWIRREAGELVRARRLPHFRFRLDEQFKKQAEIMQALRRVADEREQRGEAQERAGAEPNGEEQST